MKKFFWLLFCTMVLALLSEAQNIQNNPGSNHGNKFEQLGTILPTPNEYRTASGAPGPKYWQQRVDYDIRCELDEDKLTLTGWETITYHNNSPDVLRYLWLQLDENQHSSVKNANYQNSNTMPRQLTDKAIEAMIEKRTDNGYGFNITKVTDALNNPLNYTINKTMMRVELPVPLKPGQRFVFKIDWNYKIINRMDFQRFGGGRGGYEYFPGDGNYLFTMAQWYPRLCKYGDEVGWQNHQFTGRGEFTLSFGNFRVQMTVPADHIVGATGECQNYTQTLTPTQLARWRKAQTAKEPLEIVTLEEAKAAEKSKSKARKTWIYKADNVRDFAWTSSRKFVWDAMPILSNGKKVMCMSYYAKEAYPIYNLVSTKAVAHTIKTYSDFTIPYPYPVAISVEAANGMEYPMICFNPGRAEKDGTYSEGAKNAAILVIIHEVGHNFFPMIINSDERQWTWMDEGLNSFMQYIAQELWDNKFPSGSWGGGPAWSITEYMKLPKDQLEPIMTNSENIVQFGNNAYNKVATALNILRETIMGRELFDYAFKEYARRWAFKHPTPADFFRTMEDASGEDLDWFWRGWFFGTDAVDIAIDTVKYARPDVHAVPMQRDTVVMRKLAPPSVDEFEDISKIRNRQDKNIVFETDRDPKLQDFYWRYARGLEPYDTTAYPQEIKAQTQALDEEGKKKYADKHFYEVTFSNRGGLVMPIIIEWTYKDGTKEVDRIPAQVWRLNENKVVKTFMKDKEVASIRLDPMRETADIDESNNTWGVMPAPSRFQLFKQKQGVIQPVQNNPMQKAMEKKGF
jgi:hypothetical protein